ncbi:hypothetical protein ACI4AP_28640, partial [Klebsiella pneumoniae]
MPYEGVRSLSQFLSGAAMKEVERLERQYNDGKPFPPVGLENCPRADRWGSDHDAAQPGSARDAAMGRDHPRSVGQAPRVRVS